MIQKRHVDIWKSSKDLCKDSLVCIENIILDGTLNEYDEQTNVHIDWSKFDTMYVEKGIAFGDSLPFIYGADDPFDSMCNHEDQIEYCEI